MNNSTPAMQAQISLLDLAYQKLSGVQFRGRGVITGREDAWYRFIQAGFTLHDLETVILWLKHRIREGKRDPCCLRFSSLIGATDHFQEELSLAEAEQRNQKRPATPRERVLAQARPVINGGTPALVPDTAKPVASIIPKLLEQMRQSVETKP